MGAHRAPFELKNNTPDCPMMHQSPACVCLDQLLKYCNSD